MRVMCERVDGKMADRRIQGANPPQLWTHYFTEVTGMYPKEFEIQDDVQHCSPGDVVTLEIVITTGAHNG